LLSVLQIGHIDFTRPDHDSPSLIVVFGLSFHNVFRRGFTALFSSPLPRLHPVKIASEVL
jgi:hypothetical protein